MATDDDDDDNYKNDDADDDDDVDALGVTGETHVGDATLKQENGKGEAEQKEKSQRKFPY